MDALLEYVFNTNELTGDDYSDWEFMYGGDKKRVAKEKALPVCDNDWDFQLLRQQLYDDNFVPDGPHLEDDDESLAEASDEDSDSFLMDSSEDELSTSDADMLDENQDSDQEEFDEGQCSDVG